MNKYIKSFIFRGLIFSGLGPVIAAVVFLFLDFTIPDFSLSGRDVFLAVVSTYFLAFIQAGASVFNQVESFSVLKALLIHFSTIYVAYLLCYLVNSWIPFNPLVILIFTAIFTASYFVIWLSIYFSLRKTMNDFNTAILKK